jgi:hypothetical protein
MVNIYTTHFFAECPNNGIRIRYELRIETAEVLDVEFIVSTVEQIDHGYHEKIADDLLEAFGGTQTLIADHHSVVIETRRAK